MSQKHKNFVFGSEHFNLSFGTFWDWFSGHRGKKNFAIFLIHTKWDISGFVSETNLLYDLVLSIPNVKLLCEYQPKGWTCQQWILI